MQDFAKYFFDLNIMRQSLPAVLSGVWVTLGMGLLVIVLGLALGLLLAIMRAFRFWPLTLLIVIFVDIFRALPALVVLIVVYFALPSVGVVLSPFVSATLTLSLILAAFAEEIIWAGITSVAKGQWDAGRASGLTFSQTLLHIVLTQALKITLPSLTNRTIAIVKNTAVASAVSVSEILSQASSQQALLANPTPLTLGALFYLAIFLPLTLVSRWLERRQAWAL